MSDIEPPRHAESTGQVGPAGHDRAGSDLPGHIEVVVGRIGKPHGLRGDVTIDVRTDEPERRFASGVRLRAERANGPGYAPPVLTVAHARWHGSVLLATFVELPDRTAAEGARGVFLHTTLASDARPADPEEYYDHQLVGLVAYDVSGVELGKISAVSHGAAQDLLVVTTADGRDALVPFVAALVPEVDLSAGRVTILDRPGLVTPFPDENARRREDRPAMGIDRC
ncbi:MAG: ribosome maturation factor RimM [Nocardioides sp.]